jgi:hypothetical protein
VIFTSLAFLVIALILLIVGVISGKLAFSVAALIISIVAGLLLLVANSLYRQMIAAREGEGDLAPSPPGGTGTNGHQPVAAGTGAVAVMPVAAAGRLGPPVDGYADLTAQQAGKLADTLNLEELHGMRRYEVEHANRKVVLTAVDKRVDAILSVRRQVQGETVSSN